MTSGVVVAAIWVVLGFAIGAIAGIVLLQVLPRLQLRQHAYEDAPESHRKKTGTPTMGGIAFVAALVPLLFVPHRPFSTAVFWLVFACAAVGLADDLLAIRRGRNLGLQARTKFLLTALIAVIFLRELSAAPAIFPRDVLFHAGTLSLVVPHWLWIVLGILAITGTMHGVNLTDGLDGLAAGSMVPPLAVIAVIAAGSLVPAGMAAAALGVGACIAFLAFNRHPARMIMGDTGSLALGALLAGAAILTGEMLLLVLIGGVFVAEALSVILQVSYFKATQGKRIFRMSPLHHHFELCGWPETRVTYRFWLASLLCSAAGLAIVR